VPSNQDSNEAPQSRRTISWQAGLDTYWSPDAANLCRHGDDADVNQGCFRLLLDNVKFDFCNAGSNHSQRLSRRIRDIDNSSGNVRAAVIDPNCHGPSAGDIRHAQPCAEWQRGMSGGQIVRIELFAARGLCSLCIEAGNSLRSGLCLGRLVVRRERGMPFYGRDTPADG